MSTRVQKFIGPGDCNHRFRKPNALISRLRRAGEQAFSACLIGYIHSLICDSITLFHSDACNANALRNESMILEVLEAEEPAVFRQELFNTLEHYYEDCSTRWSTVVQHAGALLQAPRPARRRRTPQSPELQAQDEKCPAACCCCGGRWWRLR